MRDVQLRWPARTPFDRAQDELLVLVFVAQKIPQSCGMSNFVGLLGLPSTGLRMNFSSLGFLLHKKSRNHAGCPTSLAY